MRKVLAAGAAVLFLAAIASVSARAAIKGDYVEVRSADVYTGPCFANSEVDLEGKQAILAWKVRNGSWNGVDLSGLGVVAVVKASATLGDRFHNPYPADAVLILDSRASSQQRVALQAFAKSAGGRLVGNVVRVETAPINLEVIHHGTVKMVAGNLARVETRSLCDGDDICGNEEIYYPPLTKVADAMPAYTLEESFQGKGLGMVWNREGARSAFVGTFSL
ncbi:MAG TPA: DUF1326 domain-containing protein [Terriglobia bacterium]|nr:DUF1326 domain-containing protein [Terriglobia bacterium]